MDMRKLLILALTLFVSQGVFAHGDKIKECKMIAKACKSAGYNREKNGMNFWMDCMKPVLMGKSIAKVNVGADDVKKCRDAKIEKMKNELNELEAIK